MSPAALCAAGTAAPLADLPDRPGFGGRNLSPWFCIFLIMLYLYIYIFKGLFLPVFLHGRDRELPQHVDCGVFPP